MAKKSFLNFKKVKVAQSCPTLCSPTDCTVHGILQGIFPTQEWNPGLLHCRRILYQLSLKGSPPLNSLKLKGRCLKLGVVAILRVPLDCHCEGIHSVWFPIHPSPGWWAWHRAGFMARGGGGGEIHVMKRVLFVYYYFIVPKMALLSIICPKVLTVNTYLYKRLC